MGIGGAWDEMGEEEAGEGGGSSRWRPWRAACVREVGNMRRGKELLPAPLVKFNLIPLEWMDLDDGVQCCRNNGHHPGTWSVVFVCFQTLGTPSLCYFHICGVVLMMYRGGGIRERSLKSLSVSLSVFRHGFVRQKIHQLRPICDENTAPT